VLAIHEEEKVSDSSLEGQIDPMQDPQKMFRRIRLAKASCVIAQFEIFEVRQADALTAFRIVSDLDLPVRRQGIPFSSVDDSPVRKPAIVHYKFFALRERA
jgi:hypothetical protein